MRDETSETSARQRHGERGREVPAPEVDPQDAVAAYQGQGLGALRAVGGSPLRVREQLPVRVGGIRDEVVRALLAVGPAGEDQLGGGALADAAAGDLWHVVL